ncbi:MAG: DNA alkylation repair protein [Planctomycetota bacterium]|jgi:3-methyladenine DNA glycosylase AlkD
MIDSVRSKNIFKDIPENLSAEVLKKLKSMANPESAEGMARFGIKSENAYGVSIPDLRRLARQIGKNHALAGQLWSSGIHEARILAGMIDNPKQVTESQMERWVKDFDSWDLCDQCCSNLFDKTVFAYHKAIEWSARRREFVKRAGFVLMAVLAVHDKDADDDQFIQFFPIIKRQSTDERNFVKKAVNWALRQIGKRNRALNQAAIDVGQEIKTNDSKAARWIAADTLRELTSEKVQSRLRQ